MNKKRLLIIGIILIVLGIFLLVQSASAQEVSYCAERTTSGAKCQNVPLSEVNTNYRYAPTSCESTSYCKSGTCVDTSQGICTESTPESVCEEDSNGVWYEKDSDEIPVCQTGCCLMGDQAAFVTQARCQKLASIYGVSIEFREDIKDEVSCISAATPNAMGACVYETDTGRTCKMTTKKECGDLNNDANFNEGFLCSNPDLGADCGMTKETTCIGGKDEVYFLDSCGNAANVYDSSKIEDVNYWSYLPGINGVEISEGDGDGNINSRTNGNCDYYLGSTCGSNSGSPVNAQYGSYICRDLGCEWNGLEYEHGETWCVSSSGNTGENPGSVGEDFGNFDKSVNNPGSRDYRLICYNGEVTVEPCAEYRQEICVEGDVNGFSSALCKANRWQDCVAQLDKAGCENEYKRDCVWIEGITLAKPDDENKIYVYDSNSEKLVEETISEDYSTYGDTILEGQKASCVPKYAPGFDFWNSGDASTICSIANTQCFVKYETTLSGTNVVGTWGPVGKFFSNFLGVPDPAASESQIVCLDSNGNLVESWVTEINNACLALGDCGISVNYVGEEGYYGQEDLFTISEGDEENE